MGKGKIKYFWGIALLILAVMNASCSTRGVHDDYFGATEQRLLTHSIDDLVKMLPEKDFKPLTEKSINLVCHFIEDNAALKYARERIELELLEKYRATISDDPNSADKTVHIFFSAIGTDQDSFGLSTPEFVVPGISGSLGVDILKLEMYHGVSELYYYIHDKEQFEVVRGEKVKSVIRTDKLSLPVISIPLNTLD